MKKKHRLVNTFFRYFIVFMPLFNILGFVMSYVKGQSYNYIVATVVSIVALIYISVFVFARERYALLFKINFKDDEEKQSKLDTIDSIIKTKTGYSKIDENYSCTTYQKEGYKLKKWLINEIEVFEKNDIIEVYGPVEYKYYVKCVNEV